VNWKSSPRIIFLIMLTIVLVGLVMGKEGPSESDEVAKAEVLKVKAEYQEAIRTKDRAGIERVLADRLSWIARGERLDRARVIDDFMSGNLHFQSFKHDNVRVEIFGNTAIVTGHSTSVLEYQGKDSKRERLFTSVYVKMEGRWQMVSNHVTDLEPHE
jgi:ketosteroid isomerase-like protein